MKSLYINLDERTDRKEKFESQFSADIKARLGLQRLSAIPATPGFLGCSQSHINCLLLAKEQRWESVLIFEDDFELLVSPDTFLHQVETLMTKPWDVCLLTGSINKIDNTSNTDTSYVKITDVQTAVAYIVRSHYYDTLLTNYQEGLTQLTRTPTNYNTYALDQYWKQLQATDNWICSIPILGKQAIGFSNIEGKNVSYDTNYLILPQNYSLLPPLSALIILNCRKYAHKRDIQRATWLPTVGHMFAAWYHIIGDETLIEPRFDDTEHILYVPCSDGYLSLPLKTYLAIKSITERFPYVHHIVKTDDDETCQSHVIRDMLKFLIVNRVDYMGYMYNMPAMKLSTYHYPSVSEEERVPRIVYKCDYAVGRFYVVSRKAIGYILPKYDVFAKSYFEDNTLGFVLSASTDLRRVNVADKSVFYEY